MKNSILIGKIVSIHGIKGEVKVYPYTDDINHLAKKKKFYLDSELKEELKVTCRIHKNMLLVKIQGIDSCEQAQMLKEKDVYIPKENLEKDTYYIEDLIGMDIVTMTDEKIGCVSNIFHTGANDVYEVQTVEDKKIYLPAIKQVIQKIDLENKKIYVEMMEGLMS